MGESLNYIITILLIGGSIIFLTIFAMAGQTDSVSDAIVQTANQDFVNQVCAEGCITPENYNTLASKLGSTGKTYKVALKVDKKDSNLGKKTSQATANRTGSNAYVSYGTNQIVPVLESQKSYVLTPGDYITSTVIATDESTVNKILNGTFNFTGDDSYRTIAQNSQIVSSEPTVIN